MTARRASFPLSLALSRAHQSSTACPPLFHSLSDFDCRCYCCLSAFLTAGRQTALSFLLLCTTGTSTLVPVRGALQWLTDSAF